MAEETLPKYDFKIELSLSKEELNELFVKEFESRGVCPVQIEIRSDHAGFLEFGTSGSPEGKTPYKVLLPWVKAKHRGMTDTQQKKLAYAIKMKIDREGTDPHPFIRPSLEWARDLGIVSRLQMGGTMMDVADSIIQEMRYHLEKNMSIYKWEVYDGLYAHRGGEWGEKDRKFDVDEAMKQLAAEMHR